MREIPLLRAGLVLAAVAVLVAVGGTLLARRDSGADRSVSGVAAPALPAGPALSSEPSVGTTPLSPRAELAEHWHGLAPALAALDSAARMGEGRERRDAFRGAERELRRAEDDVPPASGGAADRELRDRYHDALKRLRKAADAAGRDERERHREAALREVADARAALEALAAGMR